MPPLERILMLLRRHLRSKGISQLAREDLAELVDTVFHTSLRHEEGRFISCVLSVVDEKTPGGKQPKRVLPQRATFVPFENLIPLNTRNLVKIAHALPPWASTLAICKKRDGWSMIGLFDQEIHYRNSLNQEDADKFDRAGYFQIEITDIGAFSIYDSSVLIGRYSQGTVVRHFYDVLKRGPISKILKKYSSVTHGLAKKIIKAEDGFANEPFEGSAETIMVRTLSRLLLHIRRSNHGGAILLLPRFKTRGLTIKYGIRYSKLNDVIAAHIASEWVEIDAENMIWEETDELEKENLPTFMHVRQSVSVDDKQNAIKAEIGCVSTVASMARVDGLVLLAGGLTVRGFGVEITLKQDPPAVFSAGNALGSAEKQKPLKLSDYGTRHRSMMRYCYSNPGSVGFVVSQDGDVRAICRMDNNLVVWENIKLQDVRMTPRRSSRIDRDKVEIKPVKGSQT